MTDQDKLSKYALKIVQLQEQVEELSKNKGSPTSSDADLKKSYDDGYKAGFEAGKAEVQNTILKTMNIGCVLEEESNETTDEDLPKVDDVPEVEEEFTGEWNFKANGYYYLTVKEFCNRYNMGSNQGLISTVIKEKRPSYKPRGREEEFFFEYNDGAPLKPMKGFPKNAQWRVMVNGIPFTMISTIVEHFGLTHSDSVALTNICRNKKESWRGYTFKHNPLFKDQKSSRPVAKKTDNPEPKAEVNSLEEIAKIVDVKPEPAPTPKVSEGPVYFVNEIPYNELGVASSVTKIPMKKLEDAFVNNQDTVYDNGTVFRLKLGYEGVDA